MQLISRAVRIRNQDLDSFYPARLQQKRAQRTSCDLSHVPYAAAEVPRDDVVQLLPERLGRPRSTDDVERREDGLGRLCAYQDARGLLAHF